MSNEFKDKISKAKKGKKMSDEFKEKCRLRHLGTHLSQEAKDKISVFHRAFRHSDETKKKISELQRGKIRGPRPIEVRLKISRGAAIASVNGLRPNRYFYQGIGFRSRREVAVASWLDYHDINWKYEAFIFERPNGMHYVPDFHLIDKDEFIEVTAFKDNRLVAKMNEFVAGGNTLFCITERDLDDIRLNETTKVTIGGG